MDDGRGSQKLQKRGMAGLLSQVTATRLIGLGLTTAVIPLMQALRNGSQLALQGAEGGWEELRGTRSVWLVRVGWL